MAFRIKPTGNPQGAIKKKIDWNVADAFLEAGCTGVQVAEHFGVHPDTLYTRCLQERGAGFSEYAQAKKASGEKLLAKAQFDKALGRNKDADNTMLIWLGKQRLNQRDSPHEVVVAEETVKNFENLMSTLSEIQSARKIEASNINNEEKS